MRKYLCGVNKNDCTGGNVSANNGLNKFIKCHNSRGDAFKCMRRYLLLVGYEQIDARLFRKEGQPVLVLNKKSHFGGMLRLGKNEKTARGSRYMPNDRNQGIVY